MAGLGRRSHYRKHLTSAVINDLPEPDGLSLRIARVVATRGGNMFDVIVAPPSPKKESEHVQVAADDVCQPTATDEETTSIAAEDSNLKYSQVEATNGPPLTLDIARSPQLAFLPTKFRKLVWIKRNDFVIVKCGDEGHRDIQQQKSGQIDSSSGGGFRYVITNILYKDQVKHLKSKGLWPLDSHFADPVSNASEKEPCLDDNGEEGSKGAYENHGIVFEDTDEFMVNTNRLAILRVDDSSDSSSEEEK